MKNISSYNSKTKVVQIFMAIIRNRSRPAGKIKLKFKDFFTGNPGPGRTGNPWPRPEGLPIGPRNPWPPFTDFRNGPG